MMPKEKSSGCDLITAELLQLPHDAIRFLLKVSNAIMKIRPVDWFLKILPVETFSNNYDSKTKKITPLAIIVPYHCIS